MHNKILLFFSVYLYKIDVESQVAIRGTEGTAVEERCIAHLNRDRYN